MISHKPHEEVRRQARRPRLSVMIFMLELVVYGRIAPLPDLSPLRAAALAPGSPAPSRPALFS
eukprot:4661800-Pyramimonas_sp.AAC.1